MATTRIGLDQLPPATRTAVEEHTGPLLAVEESTKGFNSEIAARVTSATGTWHIKGLRTDHSRAWTQRREATVAPFLTNLAPALRWRVEAAGWDLLGFEALGGHHADYAPGSPDLPEVASLLRRLNETPCPDIELRRAEQRLEHYAAHPDDLHYFAGTHLLHTDLNNTNVLVNARAPKAIGPAWSTGPGPPAEQPGSTPPTGPSGSSPPDTPPHPPSTGPPKPPPGTPPPPKASPPSPQPTPTSGPRSATPTPTHGPCASRPPPTPGTQTVGLAERRSAGCHQPSRQRKARIPVDCSTGILACCALSRIRTCNLMIRSSSRIGQRRQYRPLLNSGEVVEYGGGCCGCGTPLLYSRW